MRTNSTLMNVPSVPRPRAAQLRSAFSMVELLVAMTLLSLIVLALMAVFSSTETAFRASVTQTGLLEGGRAAVDLMAADLRGMTPSDGNYLNGNLVKNGNPNANFYSGTVVSSNAVNFFALDNSYASCSYLSGNLIFHPLEQTLPGSGVDRVNALNYFFVLGRENLKWTGVGYVVNATNVSPLYPLYRFYAETNISAPPATLYRAFVDAVNQSQWTNMSHVMDGVVQLTVRPYDRNGNWMTNYYVWEGTRQLDYNFAVSFMPPYLGDVGFFMFSNTVPAAVELQLGVLEDRTLKRAMSLPNLSPIFAQSNYLAGQAGHVEIFRQRVGIPNVDPAAYQ